MLQFWAKLLDFLCLLHTHLHQLKPAFQPEKGELETMMFHRTLEGGLMVHNHKVRLLNILIIPKIQKIPINQKMSHYPKKSSFPTNKEIVQLRRFWGKKLYLHMKFNIPYQR